MQILYGMKLLKYSQTFELQNTTQMLKKEHIGKLQILNFVEWIRSNLFFLSVFDNFHFYSKNERKYIFLFKKKIMLNFSQRKREREPKKNEKTASIQNSLWTRNRFKKKKERKKYNPNLFYGQVLWIYVYCITFLWVNKFSERKSRNKNENESHIPVKCNCDQ